MNKKITILVVDDSPDILDATVRSVQSAGYKTLQAASGKEALRLTEEHHPDVIILDVVMPEMDGFEVCRRIKNNPELSSIFVLMASGVRLSDDDKATGMKAAADGYLTPPWTKTVFLAQLETLIRIQQTHKSLVESSDWLGSALTGIGDAVLATDTEGKIVFMNPVAEDITGWNADDARGVHASTILRLHNDETGDPIQNPIARVLKEGIIIGLANHTMLFRKDGTSIFIADSAAPLEDNIGELIGAIMVFQDVTESRERELTLQRSRDEWEEIFNAIGHMTIIVGPDYRIQRVNRSVQSILGKQESELVGKKCFEIFHLSDEPGIGCPLCNMLSSGRMESNEMIVEALGRNYHVSCTPVMSKLAQIEKVIHIFTDVTERINAENLLKNKVASLERLNRIMVNRENRMAELKREINTLLNEAGKEKRY